MICSIKANFGQHNTAADWAGDLFKPSQDAESLVGVCKVQTCFTVYGACMTVTKKCITKRNCETKHRGKYKNLNRNQKRRKIQIKKFGFTSDNVKNPHKKCSFCKCYTYCATNIAKLTRLQNEGEFVEKCLMKLCYFVCPEQSNYFKMQASSKKLQLIAHVILLRICMVSWWKSKWFYCILPCCKWEQWSISYCPAVHFQLRSELKSVGYGGKFGI